MGMLISVINWSVRTFCCRSKTGRVSTSQLPFQYRDFRQLIIPSTSLVGWLVRSSALLIHGEIVIFAVQVLRLLVNISTAILVVEFVHHGIVKYCKIVKTADCCRLKRKSLVKFCSFERKNVVKNRLYCSVWFFVEFINLNWAVNG